MVLPTVLNKNWVFSPELGTRLDYDLYYKYVYRPSSLFLEPSYYVLFAGLGLAALLFGKEKANKKLNLMLALIVTMSIVISTSTLGILVLIVNWGIYFYNAFFLEKRKLATKNVLFFFVFCSFAVYLFSSSLAETLITRTISGGSFSTRILRGVLIAKSLNPFQLFFGVGINNISNYVQTYGVFTPYDETNLKYLSSVIGTYVMSGIVVFFLYIRMYIKSWKKSKPILGKVLVILLFIFSAIEMNSFTYRFAFYFIFIVNIYHIAEEVE